MPEDWRGRVVLITGGGRGIGRAIARACAAEGASVALVSRTAAELEETAAMVRDEPGAEAITLVADVSVRDQVDRAVDQALAHYGAIDVSGQQRRQHRPRKHRLELRS